MQWKDLGHIVANTAPMLGAVLGGSPGAAVGALISSAFGSKNEPDAILAAINADPEAALKLRQIELDNAAELQKITLATEAKKIAEETKQIQAVNSTMVAETKTVWWFTAAWRPFWGFVSATAFLAVVVGILYMGYVAIKAGKPDMLLTLPQLVMSIATLFAIPGAILGVTAWHRGQLQRVQAGEVKGASLIAAVVDRIKR